jgi:hypothetical protein
MPRSRLLTAIEEATNPDKPAPQKARKRPGPKPRVDADGRQVMKSRNTRRADMRSEEERAADLAALYSNLDDDPSVPDVAYDDPALVKLRNLLPHVPEWELRGALAPRTDTPVPASEQPASVTDQAAIVADQVAPTAATTQPLEVTREVHDPYLEVLGTFTGKSIKPAPEGSPFSTLPTVVEHTYRLVATPGEYIVQELVDGRWQDEGRGSEIGSVAFMFAYRQIDCPQFHELAKTVPSVRPRRQAQLDAGAAQSSQKPLTGEAREHRDAQVREAVAEQRARWRRCLPTPQSDLTWFDNI